MADNEQEINRKRKSTLDNDDVITALSLSTPPTTQQTPPLLPSTQLLLHHPPTLQLPSYINNNPAPPPLAAAVRSRTPSRTGQVRTRRNPTQGPHDSSKSDTIPQPFPWATTRRATVEAFNNLLSKQITTITGEVQCKKCDEKYEMDLDLREKFIEIGSFIAKNKATMHDRAPSVWMNPTLPTCKLCGQVNSAKPIISEKKKTINWLFLLLGQMLGCCTLDQLRYFCKHTKNHRTGAKDRVLYTTYLQLCKQLDPTGPFDH